MVTKKVKVLKPWTNGPTIHVVGSTVNVSVYDPASGGKAEHIEHLSVSEFDSLVKAKYLAEEAPESAVAAADKATKK